MIGKKNYTTNPTTVQLPKCNKTILPTSICGTGNRNHLTTPDSVITHISCYQNSTLLKSNPKGPSESI